MASVVPWIADAVAHLPEVRAAVHATAETIGSRAASLLAAHRVSGASRIEVTQGERTDSYVHLVDKAAVSIEFGHFTDNGEVDAVVSWVPGLAILARAARL